MSSVQAGYRRQADAGYLFITNRSSKLKFLIETGADIFVLPVAPKDRRNKARFAHYAANGTTIATFGQRFLGWILDYIATSSAIVPHSGTKQAHSGYGLFGLFYPSGGYSRKIDKVQHKPKGIWSDG